MHYDHELQGRGQSFGESISKLLQLSYDGNMQKFRTTIVTYSHCLVVQEIAFACDLLTPSVQVVGGRYCDHIVVMTGLCL